MAKRKTFLDSCVIISAFRGSDAVSEAAMGAIDDPEREFVISDFLRLELLPKPTSQRKNDELEFINTFFDGASEEVASSAEHVEEALKLACRYGLSAVDALHAMTAIESNVDDFITAEKKTKPFGKIDTLNVVFIPKA